MYHLLYTLQLFILKIVSNIFSFIDKDYWISLVVRDDAILQKKQ